MNAPPKMCTFCGQMFIAQVEQAYIVMSIDAPLVKATHTQLLLRKDQVKPIACCVDCFNGLPPLTGPHQTNT
jgi:hypothetical protein